MYPRNLNKIRDFSIKKNYSPTDACTIKIKPNLMLNTQFKTPGGDLKKSFLKKSFRKLSPKIWH